MALGLLNFCGRPNFFYIPQILCKNSVPITELISSDLSDYSPPVEPLQQRTNRECGRVIRVWRPAPQQVLDHGVILPLPLSACRYTVFSPVIEFTCKFNLILACALVPCVHFLMVERSHLGLEVVM